MLQAIADIWSGQEERLLPCQPSVSIVHAFKFNALSVQVRILSMGWAYAHICARAYVHTCMHGCMYMYTVHESRGRQVNLTQGLS